MRFCEECGAKLEDDALFCEECGAKVEPLEEVVEEEAEDAEEKKVIEKESTEKAVSAHEISEKPKETLRTSQPKNTERNSKTTPKNKLKLKPFIFLFGGIVIIVVGIIILLASGKDSEDTQTTNESNGTAVTNTASFNIEPGDTDNTDSNETEISQITQEATDVPKTTATLKPTATPKPTTMEGDPPDEEDYNAEYYNGYMVINGFISGSSCKSLWMNENLGCDTGYVIYDSDLRLLSDDDLYGFTKEELRIARNEIMARHGRKFSSEDLTSYFNGCSWYNPVYDPDSFNTSMLSDIENANINFIKSFEETGVSDEGSSYNTKYTDPVVYTNSKGDSRIFFRYYDAYSGAGIYEEDYISNGERWRRYVCFYFQESQDFNGKMYDATNGSVIGNYTVSFNASGNKKYFTISGEVGPFTFKDYIEIHGIR